MIKFKILTILFLLTVGSCGQNQLVPVRGPESDPGQELNFSEFNDFPIPINSKLIKGSVYYYSQKKWLVRKTFFYN